MEIFGERIAPKTLRVERLLPGPIERVWSYLTESGKRGQWFASGTMELHVGGKLDLLIVHSALSAEPTPDAFKPYEAGFPISGRITRCEPPRLLGCTMAGNEDDASEVVFELIPQGPHVLLVLTQYGLSDDETPAGTASGWHSHLGILEDRLNGVEPRPFWTWLAEIEAEYKKRFGDAVP